jgi:hypothetical protein
MEIGSLVWQIITILVALAGIYSAFNSGRRNPPLPEDLAKNYVTKDEFHGLRTDFESHRSDDSVSRARMYEKIDNVRKELAEQLDRQSENISDLRAEINKSLLAIERSLGRLEDRG